MTRHTQDQRRGITPRDWVIVGVVAAIAIALTGVIVFQDDSGSDTAATVPTKHTTDATVPEETPDQADPTATETPTDTGSTDSGLPDGVVDTMIQPEAVGDEDTADSESAERIGPLGDLSRRIDGDPFALGDVDAPVVIVSFEDYRCPFCGQFARETLPRIIDEYVDTGIVRYEWRDLPIFGSESTQAAIAGRAAAKQGKFWEFNAAIYADAPKTGHADVSRDDLIDYARQVGVDDIAAFTEDLDDPDLADAVEDDIEQGSFLGVPSTPSFVIDGYPIVGAQPYETFAELIDTVQTL